MEDFRFEVAISFAGDNKRELVKRIAEILREAIGDGKVFYDDWFLHEIAGMDAHKVLQNIYRQKSRLVVACLCTRYVEKPWTQDEWRAIEAFERDLRDAGSDNLKRQRLLLLAFDNGPFDHLVFDTTIVPPVEGQSAEEIAGFILKRLSLCKGLKPSAVISCLADAPRLPLGYLKRVKYLAVLGSAFSELGQGRPVLRVILGPSGTGKSALATDFFLQAQGAYKRAEVGWIDCRVTFKMPEALPGLKLVVFDNVTDNHPLMAQKWLLGLREAIVVLTTTSARVSIRVRGDLSVADQDASLLLLNGFDEDEVREFLNISVPQGCVDDAVACARGLGGLPIGLQLLREVCTSASTSERFAHCDGLAGLIQHWLIGCDETGSIAAVLEVLGGLPFVGMDVSAIAQVLATPIEEVQDALAAAKRNGLVREACVPNQAVNESIFVLHESVRETYVDNKSDDLQDWTRRYLKVLEERLTTGHTGAAGVLTCVDAWLVGWKQVFDLSVSIAQSERFENHRKLLERLAANETEAWANAVASLPHFLVSRLQKPDTENCAIVIVLAQMIGRLKGSRALAMTIWDGARNPDLWARAASIAATVRQWDKLGATFRRNGISELQFWLKYATEMRERATYDPASRWTSDLDFDYLVVVCGLMKLENLNSGVMVVESADFLKQFHGITLSRLAVLLKQAETGILDTPDRKQVFLRQAARWTTEIELSPVRVQETAARLGAYLSVNFDCSIKQLTSLPDPGGESTFALDIAYLSDSSTFAEFTRQSETSPQRYL